MEPKPGVTRLAAVLLTALLPPLLADADITNADYGETYMNLMQKMMSYQAMLQSVAKINQLSLLNYM